MVDAGFGKNASAKCCSCCRQVSVFRREMPKCGNLFLNGCQALWFLFSIFTKVGICRMCSVMTEKKEMQGGVVFTVCCHYLSVDSKNGNGL